MIISPVSADQVSWPFQKMTSVSCRSLAYSHSSLQPGYEDADEDDNDYDDGDDNDDDDDDDYHYDYDDDGYYLPLCGWRGSRPLHADCPAWGGACSLNMIMIMMKRKLMVMMMRMNTMKTCPSTVSSRCQSSQYVLAYEDELPQNLKKAF